MSGLASIRSLAMPRLPWEDRSRMHLVNKSELPGRARVLEGVNWAASVSFFLLGWSMTRFSPIETTADVICGQVERRERTRDLRRDPDPARLEPKTGSSGAP